MKRSKLEIFTGNDHKYYWRLKGGNGEIQCISEAYTSPGNARRGAKDARRNIVFAKFVEMFRK